MPLIKLTKSERKRFLVIVGCFFLAVIAWLFLALNKKYPYSVNTELIYKDEPQGKAFKALQPDVVELKVEGTGWQLVFSKLRIKPPSVTVSLQNLNTQNYILCSEQLRQINNQLETQQNVISIHPDTLFFDFSKRTNKRIPVKLVSAIDFQPQYDVFKDVQLTPAYVNISGPYEELAKINAWYTDTLKLENVKSTVETRVNILQNAKNNITIYPNSVGVKIAVDEFTEKTLEVPIVVTNNNDFLNVKIFPKKVKVTLLVALSNYASVTENTIRAEVDLNDWKVTKHNTLSVNITKTPAFCKRISMVPNNVDFIIEK